MQQNLIKEDTVVVEDMGVFLVTNARTIYLSEKLEPQFIGWDELESVDFDGATLVTYTTKAGEKWIYKYPDEAADVLHIIVGRIHEQIKVLLAQLEAEKA